MATTTHNMHSVEAFLELSMPDHCRAMCLPAAEALQKERLLDGLKVSILEHGHALASVHAVCHHA